MSLWDSDEPVPRTELLKGVQGADGILCLLTEKIDAEVLDAAGTRLGTGSGRVSTSVAWS